MRLRQYEWKDPDKALARRDRWLLDLDFVKARHRVGKLRSSRISGLTGVTYTGGAGFKLSQTASGLWVPEAANDPGETDAGFASWEARTNKCSNFNGAPNGSLTGVTASGDAAAVLSEVDDTSALQSAGFGALITAGKMNGKVFKLDNTGGSTFAFMQFSGVTGNTNSHVMVVYWRGTGTSALAVGNETVQQPLPVSYARFAAVLTPLGVSTVSRVKVAAGSVVFVILNELIEEVADIADPPIIVAGLAATRTADALSVNLGRAFPAAAGTLFVQTARVNNPTAATYVVTQDPNVSGLVRWVSNNTIQSKGVGGVALTINLPSGTNASRVRAAITWDLAGRSGCANGGVVASDAILHAFNGTTLNIGHEGDATGQPDAVIERVLLMPGRMSNGAIQGITTL